MTRDSSFSKGFGAGCGLVFGILAAICALLFVVCGGIISQQETTWGGVTKSQPPQAPSPETVVAFGRKATVNGNVEISITEARVGRVDGANLGQPSESREEHLMFAVQLRNTNATRKYEYTSWNESRPFGDNVSLQDDLGNQYRGIDFDLFTEVSGQVKHATLYSGSPVSDLLVFQRPVQGAKSLLLTLPLSRIGERGKLTFRIPTTKVTGL